MARELSIVVKVESADAERRLDAVDKKVATVGGSSATASKSVSTLEGAVTKTATATTAATVAVDKYATLNQSATKEVTGLSSKVVNLTRAVTEHVPVLSTASQALNTYSDTATRLESSTLGAASATQGLVGQVSSGILKFTPYAIAAEVVTSALVGWYEAHEKARIATETLGAKQDTIARAMKFNGGIVLSYADAVKYMNEQFARQPAFVDNAATALEHWTIALKKGPLNAQQFAANDLGKNVADAAATVQKELGHIGFDTIDKALDQLRKNTVLGDAAFNQWAKDLGLSSVTIGILREQVQAEETATKHASEAQKKAAEDRKRHTTEIQRQADALTTLTARVRVLNEVNAEGPAGRSVYKTDAGELPGVALLKDYSKAMDQLHSQLQKALTIDPHTIELAIAGSGSFGLEKIGQPLEKVVYEKSESGFAKAVQSFPDILQRALTGGGGFLGAIQAFTSKIGSVLGEGLFNAGGLLSGLGGKLALKFGDAFGLALPGIGAALGSVVGPIIGKLYDTIKHAFGGPSSQELAGRGAESQFQSQFGSFDDMVNRVGDAFVAVGKSRAEAEAAVKAMLDAEKQGADAVRAAIDKLSAAMAQADKLKAGATQFGPSQSELVQAEKDAHDVLDYMVRMQQQGEYTQEQVDAAYLAWQRALAAAGNEAAKAWVKVHDAAVSGATASNAALDALKSKRDSLAQSVANEAPEEVMGVIEAQTRGQIDALDKQIAQQQEELAKAAEDTKATIESTLGDIRITIPIDFEPHYPSDWPGGGGGYRWDGEAPEPIPMASGGRGRTNGPTWFYSGGDEDFAFSGEGKTFGTGIRPQAAATTTQNTYVIHAVDAASFESLAQRHPEIIASAALKGVQGGGKRQQAFRTMVRQVPR